MTDFIKLNGAAIFMPSKHGWVPTDSLGKGGRGQEVLTSIWEYQLSWDTLIASDFSQLHTLWLANINSQMTAFLPILGNANYVFGNFTCMLNPIVYETFSDGAYLNVATKLSGIDITA